VQSFKRYNIFCFFLVRKYWGAIALFGNQLWATCGKQQGLPQTKCKFWPKGP